MFDFRAAMKITGTVAVILMLLGGVGLSTAESVPATTAIVIGDDCILGCEDRFTGGPCVDYQHVAPKEGDYARYGDGWQDSCFDGNCNCGETRPDGEDVEPKHFWCPWDPNCGGGGGSSFARAVTDGDSEAIVRALAEGGRELHDAIRLVGERQAVQLVGCSQKLVAHLPVSEQTLGLLADLMAE